MADRDDDDHTILLARHGETDWNRVGRWQGATDIPLSDVGRVQARALARRLAGHDIRRVYSSHLSRARETADIVVATLGLPLSVSIDPRLGERGYGCFEGLTRAECATQFPDAWERYLADRRVVPPAGEAHAVVVQRFTAAMKDMVSVGSRPGTHTLVISHGGSIRTFVHAAVGVALPPLENGAVVRLAFRQGVFSVREPIVVVPGT